MVECVANMLFDNLSLCIECHDFQDAGEGIDEDDEEQQDRPPEEAGGIFREIVEDTADDQGFKKIADQHRQGD